MPAGLRTPLFSRNQPGGAFTISDIVNHPGQILFVHSGTGTDAAGNGDNPDAPLATVDYAVGLCTASKGDTIYVMPGHAETISTATGFVLDVAGVRVIGLGQGTIKPVFTFSATDSILSITAANCWVENIRLLSNIDNCVTAISLGGSADGCTLKNVEIVDGAANKEFLVSVAIATACHDVTLDGVRHHGLGGGATSCVKTAGTADRLTIVNCQMHGTYTGSVLDLSAGACLNMLIRDNFLCNEDTSASLCYKGHASNTGIVVRNMALGTKNNTETINTVNAIHCAENYGTDTVATSGILTPAALTAWS